MARWATRSVFGLVALMLAARGAVAENILETVGLTDCSGEGATITVQKIDMKYKSEAKEIWFDVRGVSQKEQKVKAYLSVQAYGQLIYENRFDPCDEANFIEQLCPVPQGSFGANGTLPIPDQYASMVPAIAFQVPDISAVANLQLLSEDSSSVVACVESQVTNGKTASVAAVSYVAAGLAGIALVVSGVSAAGAALSGSSAAGMSTTLHPSFSDFMGTMQGIATTGMMSVTYPPIVRSFTSNFAFSTGLIPWAKMQVAIDDFRGATGGNLTRSSYDVLKNTTLVFNDGSTLDASSRTSLKRRALETFIEIMRRDVDTSVSSDTSTADSGDEGFVTTIKKEVAEITAFSESLMIPESNTFMTMLLIICIVIAAIVVSILLFKVILELWALCGKFPQKFHGLRDDYWGIMTRTITNLVLLLYGIWVMFSIYQFTNGDSWAAIALAGTTLAGFTLLIAFFAYKIFATARKLQETTGSMAGLFENKELWTKYSLFYESYRQSRWWLFIPNIVYVILRAVIIAGLAGQGMAQTVALLAVDSVMLMVTCVTRPFERKSGNVINICILVVRVISTALLLVFVEQLGMSETTKSISGVALIAVQSALTGVLGILIIWNAFIAMCKENPHRKRRKEMEKVREEDALTPLDARNSLLGPPSNRNSAYRDLPPSAHDQMRAGSMTPAWRPASPDRGNGSRDSLVAYAAPIGREAPSSQGSAYAYGGYDSHNTRY